MSEPTYSLEIAIRADEKAKSAHERLDRMNGSIDRLAGQVAETNGKIDTIVTTLARSDGIELGEGKERSRWLDSRRFIIATLAVLLGALLASVGTQLWLAFG